MALTDDELYAGIARDKAERYRREAREMYGKAVVEGSERRAKGMSKEKWQAVKDEGEAVTQGLAAVMDRRPDDPKVQALIDRHYQWVSTFWTPDASAYEGLGQLYTDNPEFRATYDGYRLNLADFLRQAMTHYAQHTLARK